MANTILVVDQYIAMASIQYRSIFGIFLIFKTTDFLVCLMGDCRTFILKALRTPTHVILQCK